MFLEVGQYEHQVEFTYEARKLWPSRAGTDSASQIAGPRFHLPERKKFEAQPKRNLRPFRELPVDADLTRRDTSCKAICRLSLIFQATSSSYQREDRLGQGLNIT